MNVAVFGLWHLGCVTAACLAEAGHRVVGLDLDADVVARLRAGHAPLHEPGLDELICAGLASGALSFSDQPAEALASAEVAWITFDTPVDDDDQADVAYVRRQVDTLGAHLRAGTLVLVSSQVPVGFTRELGSALAPRGVSMACSPENLRLGHALEAFRQAQRTVVGLGDERDRARVEELLGPFCERIEWTSLESAEMAKHALNAFLGLSAVFANELARLGERLGADAREVERALKSEPRVGPRAYLAPGAPLAGGTLARDLRYLSAFGRRLGVPTPLVDGVLASNERHRAWLMERVLGLLGDTRGARVAVLGLTYKPGTSTLRRSMAVELCRALAERGADVRAHEPAVAALPEDMADVRLCATPAAALMGAELAVIATAWPDFRSLRPEDFVAAMRVPRVVDPHWLLADALARDERITYVAPGRPAAGL